MADEKRIAELEKRIQELGRQVTDQEEKLMLLRNELDGLRGKTIEETASKRLAGNFRLENFIGLKLIHLVGIVVLVIGLSLGVKYAIDRQLISEASRIMLVYAAGLVLYVLSRRLKKKYQVFSAILFSGSMASLYFTTYAALVYYGFFSFALAFLLMVALTIYTACEAIRYNRQEIAILGMVGAYAIPFLISAKAERADLYFSYIILINLGIVFLSFLKKWKLMGQLALFITWGLFIGWGFSKYAEKDFPTGLILVIIFYFLFMVNALAYRLLRSETLTAGDIQQVMVNNIAAYLSMLIVFGYGEFGANLSITSGFIALFISFIAFLSWVLFPAELVLQQTLAMQAVISIALFIGLEWNGLIVTLLWVGLAALLFGWGIYNHRSWPRLAAILLMSVTLGKLIIFDSGKFSLIQKIISYLVIGSLLLVLSFFYQKYKQRLFEEKSQ